MKITERMFEEISKKCPCREPKDESEYICLGEQYRYFICNYENCRHVYWNNCLEDYKDKEVKFRDFHEK